MSTSTTTKTRLIASLAISVATLSLLAGCTGGNDTTDRIMDKLDTMQQEIDTLKDSVASGGASTGQDTGTGTDSGASDSSQAPADKSGFETKLTDLEQRAATAVGTAKKATAPANAADRPKAYIEAKAPLEALEIEVDALEDQLEAAVRAGEIDRQTYFTLDQRADAIDDTLDQAKDSLELIMGVDD